MSVSLPKGNSTEFIKKPEPPDINILVEIYFFVVTPVLLLLLLNNFIISLN